MFKNNIIKKKVLAIINQKIKDAQKAHEEEVKVICDNYKRDVEALESKAKADEEASLTKHINSITSKFI